MDMQNKKRLSGTIDDGFVGCQWDEVELASGKCNRQATGMNMYGGLGKKATPLLEELQGCSEYPHTDAGAIGITRQSSCSTRIPNGNVHMAGSQKGFPGHQREKLALPKILTGHWSESENLRLKRAIEEFGTTSWRRISAIVATRTAIQCKQKWFAVMDPSLKKGGWTSEEDALLLLGIARFGKSWTRIAEIIPGRNAKQARERWIVTKNPHRSYNSWLRSEDGRLREKVAKNDGAFASMRNLSPNGNELKFRYDGLDCEKPVNGQDTRRIKQISSKMKQCDSIDSRKLNPEFVNTASEWNVNGELKNMTECGFWRAQEAHCVNCVFARNRTFDIPGSRMN